MTCHAKVGNFSGNIYVSLSKFKKEPNKVMISLSGIGGQLQAVYDPEKAVIDFCYPPRKNAEIHSRIRENADFLIKARITFKSESSDRFYELESVLETNEIFHIRIQEILEEAKSEYKTEEKIVLPISNETVTKTTDKIQEKSVKTEGSKPIIELRKKVSSIKAIWQATIDTEAEALPRIEVADDPKLTRDSTELVVPFSSEDEVLDAYARDDRVELIRLNGEKTMTIGRVSISRSTPSLLRVELRYGSFARVSTGETLFLRTKQDRSSFTRRKTALTRIIERRSVIKNLIDYFEPTCCSTPKILADITKLKFPTFA